MYTRERAGAARAALSVLMAALLDRAQEHVDWPMPGYTHLQRAQPVYLGHHLLAYFWMLARDRARFAFAQRESSRLPLGAGALAGVSFDTDRGMLARELGFAEVAPNSIDAVSGRDFAFDYLNAAAHLRHPPVAAGGGARAVVERRVRLLRAAGRLSSAARSCLRRRIPTRRSCCGGRPPRWWAISAPCTASCTGCRSTYNKDLQEDKEHLFDAAETIELSLAAVTGMVAGARFDRERMVEASCDELVGATDVADMLVRHGVPFREAHGVVAGIVRAALDDVASSSS